MRTSLLFASAGLALASSVVWIACSSNSNNGGGSGSDGGSSSGTASSSGSVTDGGLFALGVPCTDSIASVYGDPGTLPTDKGAIIKCAVDTDLSASDLAARLAGPNDTSTDPAPATNINYLGGAFTSGAHVYRVLYRTERGDTASSPGYSSALVLVPTVPRAKGTSPLLVGARGSRGQGPQCTASEETEAGAPVDGDYQNLSYPMVGLGFPIIVPDLAGYANFGATGNPVSGYAAAADVGKSTLDGARALMKMFPSAFNGKIGIIGHSQGGHSALASLALAGTYAHELTISAVAVYSPLWISQATWGALLYEAPDYPLGGAQAQPTPTAVSIWYHYTHGELLDGPGHGVDVFAADQQATIKNFVQNDCWADGYNGSDAGTEYPDLQEAGVNALSFFDPSFVTSIQKAAALGDPCAAGDAVCAKWVARYAADRPHLSNTPPMLIEYGADDETIAPPLMACVLQRLQQDNAGYTFCLDPLYGHTSIVRAHAADVAAWFGSQLLGEAAPAACPYSDKNLTDDGGTGGTPIQCETPPPNN